MNMNNFTILGRICCLLLISLFAPIKISTALALVACTTNGKTSSESDSNSSEIIMHSPLPGATTFDNKLIYKFNEMRKQRGKDYQPRTKHFQSDGWAKYTNRLFLESSTYLLQHAHNPVNWFPWGDEAFDLAKKLNRPVLVSIGYSTCHWCHVMENESFEDEEIARYLNENFILIKVDREERPDLDAIYMSAVQAITGRGGWPLNVWLTPDRKPFYGGTYFSPKDLMSVLKNVKEVFASKPEQIAESSQKLSLIIKQALSPEKGEGILSANIMHSAALTYQNHFDIKNGGLQGSPKFPSSLPVRFLLRYQHHTEKNEFQNMAELTLKKMAAGGMYDQVGGGFHRYSTDDKWLVPHFEKMLYDNALLVITYLEGYQVTKNKNFERITREILRYFERDLSAPGGALYAASDADSLAPSGHQEEGYFFTWTPKELEQELGKGRAKIVEAYYGVTEQGNFEGRNILHVPQLPSAIAQSLKISEGELIATIDESKELLYQSRLQRPLPLRDEKILTAWNGLAISAYARAGLILNDKHYVEQAIKTARFILQHCYAQGRLFRNYKDGKARGNAYLEDYSFFIAALLDLSEATNDPQWLELAIELDNVLQTHYEDRDNGGFFMTGNDHEVLLAKEKPAYDGATPSGNSVQILNLLRLAEFTANENYRKRAEKAMKSFSGTLSTNPIALSEMLLALDFYLDTPKEIIIVTPKENKESASSLLSIFREQFLPNRIIMVVTEGKELETITKIIPLIGEKKTLNGKATAYVCENKSCQLPTGDPEVFAEQIRRIKMLP